MTPLATSRVSRPTQWLTNDIDAPAATLRERQGRTRRVGQILLYETLRERLRSVQVTALAN